MQSTSRPKHRKQSRLILTEIRSSEDTDSIILTGRKNDSSAAQDNPHAYHELPPNKHKSDLRSQFERVCGQEAMVIISHPGTVMSHQNSQSSQLPVPITNYSSNFRSTGCFKDPLLANENGKKRISEELGSSQENRGKRRKIFERSSTLTGQVSSSRFQSLATPRSKLSTDSSAKPPYFERAKKSFKETFPNSVLDISVNQTNRTRQTRISSDGQIQKHPRLSDRSQDRLSQILERHVFIHVRKAMRPYHKEITKEDRAKIGADAVQIVIEHPDFKKHFKANGNSILPDYESLLASQASSYVNGRARQILGDEIVNRLLHYPIRHHVPSKSTSYSDIKSCASSNCSDSSTEQEDIFCRQEEVHARSNSFSPSTSLSTDQTDIETIKKTGNSPCHEPVSMRRAARLTRASNPIYTKPSTRKTVKPQHHNLASGYDNHDCTTDGSNVPRPYLRLNDRKTLIEKLMSKSSDTTNFICEEFHEEFPHTPFTEPEVCYLVALVKRLTKRVGPANAKAIEVMTYLMAGRIQLVLKIADCISYTENTFSSVKQLHGRKRSDIIAFLLDTVNDTVLEFQTLEPTVLSPVEPQTKKSNFNPINRLLRHREIDGLFPARIRRGQTSYREIVSSFLEDTLVPQSEWADCSNDIAAITWTSNDAFIVGALAHSDPHNMQYNKPGNLLVGSVSQDTLKSYPHHRIERPLISEHQNLENSLDSMRATQSPWLYTSVVSSAHSSVSGYSFTSSYDNTVKVWKVLEDGSGMISYGTWTHDAKVNFVVTSEHHDRVATASGTNRNAVRVYHFYEHAIDKCPYDEYGGNKSQQQSGDVYKRRPWAYQPATIKWARSLCISNLFLVGYSPRADSGDDSDIPGDKKNTGELCVWDSEDRSRYNVSSARMQNVFDAVWHPTQPVFAAATSPFGNYDSERTKTQVRIFALNDYTFTSIMTLDCPALDITELTLMPNSAIKAYITASCTDGCTYVWDVAQGEDPIHILRHGESIDNPEPNLPLELADGGVTFSAWGADVSRFYTGATDGKLIAWDIRKSSGNAFVRNVLELSGGISCGAFTKDFKKLLIGDSTGKVHLLGIDDSDFNEGEDVKSDPFKTAHSSQVPRLLPSCSRHPKIVIPHPEPVPPKSKGMGKMEQSYQESSHKFLDKGILRIYPGKGVFQGPQYHESGLFRADAHEDEDILKPLKPEVMAIQQFLQHEKKPLYHIPRLPQLNKSRKAIDHKAHIKNVKLDLEFSHLTLQTKEELKRDRAEFNWDEEMYNFEYEITPRSSIFRAFRKGKRRTTRSIVALNELDELAMGV